MSYRAAAACIASGAIVFAPRAYANNEAPKTRVWMSGTKLAIPGGSLSDLDRPTPVEWFSLKKQWTKVSTGPHFGGGIGDDDLFVWGHNGTDFVAPKRVDLGNAVDVQCSASEIYVLTSNGKVFVIDWESGVKHEIITNSFFKKWTQISVGGSHIALVDNSGCVWTMGSNECGQCGVEVEKNLKKDFHTDKIKPLVLKTELQCVYSDKAKSVACGGSHTMILTMSGKVFSFGDDSKIQLGLGDTRSYDTPDYVPHSKMGESDIDPRKLFKSTMGSVKYSWYEKHMRDKLSLINGLLGKQIVAGKNFSLVQTQSNDMILGCGENQKGQCGRGFNRQQQTFSAVKLPKKINVDHFECGSAHCVAQLADGSIWTWGDNKEGQLGTGSRSAACPPVVIHRSKIRGPLCKDIITPIGKSATKEELECFGNESHIDQNVASMNTHPTVNTPSGLKTQLIDAIDASRANFMMSEQEQTKWEPVTVSASYNNTVLIMRQKPEETKP